MRVSSRRALYVQPPRPRAGARRGADRSVRRSGLDVVLEDAAGDPRVQRAAEARTERERRRRHARSRARRDRLRLEGLRKLRVRPRRAEAVEQDTVELVRRSDGAHHRGRARHAAHRRARRRTRPGARLGEGAARLRPRRGRLRVRDDDSLPGRAPLCARPPRGPALARARGGPRAPFAARVRQPDGHAVPPRQPPHREGERPVQQRRRVRDLPPRDGRART
jgi:hypothetical protein